MTPSQLLSRTGGAIRVPARSLASAPDRRSVTVVVPCHDYARYLPDSVGSALAQQAVDVQVVIVDDASTDDSVRVAEELCRDPRVQLLQNAQNRGPAMTFNAGLAAATGDYLVRLDADDLLTPGSLSRSAALLGALPDVGLVYGHPKHFTGPVPRRTRTTVRDWTLWPGRSWLELACRRGINVITSPEVMMRAAVVHQVGGQRAELAHTHDMEHWLRIASVCEVGRVNGPDQALHREHPTSLSTSSGPLGDLLERRAAFDLLFATPALRDATALHDDARRALAGQALDRACRAHDRGRLAVEPVQAYVDLAVELWPGVEELAEWRALQRRRRAAPGRRPYSPLRLARAARRRRREEWSKLRWQRTGA